MPRGHAPSTAGRRSRRGDPVHLAGVASRASPGLLPWLLDATPPAKGHGAQRVRTAIHGARHRTNTGHATSLSAAGSTSDKGKTAASRTRGAAGCACSVPAVPAAPVPRARRAMSRPAPARARPAPSAPAAFHACVGHGLEGHGWNAARLLLESGMRLAQVAPAAPHKRCSRAASPSCRSWKKPARTRPSASSNRARTLARASKAASPGAVADATAAAARHVGRHAR
jgi:hypothetical protein